jgi:hypothetical protein
MSDDVMVAWSYAVGEEVVVLLDHAEVFDLLQGCTVPTSRIPGWTIGTIIHRAGPADRPVYVVRFRSRGNTCLCAVPETCIEGTA